MTRTLLTAALVVAASPALAYDQVVLDAPVLVGAEVAPIEEVELADMDRDGDLDLVVCGDGGTGWYLQDPSGWTWVAGPTGACEALEVADMDRDGQPDVLALEPGVGILVHYLDSPTTWTSYNTQTSGSYSATILDFGVGDVDEDGWLDVRSNGEGGFTILTYLNPGGRTADFPWTRLVLTVGDGTQVELGDFDNNGGLDLAVLDATTGGFQIRWSGGGVEDFGLLAGGADNFTMLDADEDGVPQVFFWSAAGSLQYREQGNNNTYGIGGQGMTAVSVAEFDLDGRREIVGVRNGMIRVEHEDYMPGDFVFGQDVVAFVPTGEVDSIADDLDGDGDTDLVLYDDAGVHVSVNRIPHVPTEYIQDYTIAGTWNDSTLVLSGQLDHVLMEDLVVAGRSGAGLTAMLTPTFLAYPPPFEAHTITTRTIGSAGVLADLDLDGDLDVIAVDDAGDLYAWKSQSGATVWVEYDLGVPAVSSIAVADIDRDGDPDLVLGTRGAPGEVLWLDNPRSIGSAWTSSTLANAPGAEFVGLEAGDIDHDGDIDLVALADDGATEVWWLEHPGDPTLSWTVRSLYTSATASKQVALLDADHDGWLDLWVDDAGTLQLLTSLGAPNSVPWASLSSLATGGQLSSPPADMDADGALEVLVWDGTGVWTHGYDGHSDTWESAVLLHEVLDAPRAMTAFIRGPWDALAEPVVALGGPAPGVTWTMTATGDPITSAPLPVPIDSGHLTHLDPWVIAVPTSSYGAKPGDAPVFLERIRLRGDLDGSGTTGATLQDFGTWTVWRDSDGNDVLDTGTDTLVPITVSASDIDLNLVLDPAGGEPIMAPQSSATWFVQLAPSEAATLQPAQALELRVRHLLHETFPQGEPVDTAGTHGVTGTWTIGNTPPQMSTQALQVDEGAELLFDPLELVTDPEGDPLSVVGLAGQPLHGLAVLEGTLVRYSHDGSEDAEDFVLVELSDGLETVARIAQIAVVPVDDPPWADNAVADGPEDRPIEIALVGGDPDDTPVFELLTQPANGSAVLADTVDGPVVTYTPDLNHTGPDSFQFTVRGGAVTSSAATVSLTLFEDLDDDDDGDGFIDRADLCPDVPDPANVDTDLDGLGDACDDDDDGDGIPDATDPCPNLAAPSDTGVDDPCLDDDDGDGVLDDDDLCPFVADPAQDDFDGDGLGDVCDPDDDNDLVVDDQDNCPQTSNLAQLDADGDELGDACDDDDDGDGVDDTGDVCPWTADPGQDDLDADGVGDACDDDVDGDGAPTVLDCDDGDPAVQDPLSFYEDTDGDGFGDPDATLSACASSPPAGASWDGSDNCPEDANPDQSDIDGDGLGDLCDPTPGNLDAGDSGTKQKGDGGGCGCSQTGFPTPWGGLLLVLLARRRTGHTP